MGLKNFPIVEEFNSTPAAADPLIVPLRYVYESQMNVAKPFSALIGVYIKVISSAVLVLTKVYTQTRATAKTFTLINLLLSQITETAWSHSQGTKIKNYIYIYICIYTYICMYVYVML